MPSSKGFKAIENRLDKLVELVMPSQKDPIMIDLLESYGTEVGGGDKVVELAIQPDTRESFLVVKDTDFDFQI